jgi:hypothetical protein
MVAHEFHVIQVMVMLADEKEVTKKKVLYEQKGPAALSA